MPKFSTLCDHLILLAGCAIMAGPVVMLLAQSLAWSPGMPFTDMFEQYHQALVTPMGYTGAITPAGLFANSLAVALAFGVLKTALSVISAYALVFYRVRWASFWFWSILITLFLPLEARPIPTVLVANYFQLNNTLPGLVVPLLTSGLGVFLFRQFLLAFPREITEAARLDGASSMAFLCHFILPLSVPFMVALFAIYFAEGWNQYMWPLMTVSGEENYTLLRAIELVSAESARGRVFIAISFLPPFILALICSRFIASALFVSSRS